MDVSDYTEVVKLCIHEWDTRLHNACYYAEHAWCCNPNGLHPPMNKYLQADRILVKYSEISLIRTLIFQ